MPLDDLVNHALKALASSAGDKPEDQLKPENTSIGIVGVDQDFTCYSGMLIIIIKTSSPLLCVIKQ